LLPHVTRWQEFIGELARVARQAIVLDYPEVRSINYATPFLFEFKKSMEVNTRTYTCFREKDLLSVVRSHGFERAGRYAEFFFPMVLHRKLNALQVSKAIEGVSRTIGLTGWLGSPVILKLVRMGG
jgi:hypothetical protein